MKTILLILFSVSCSGIAQLFLKKGSMGIHVNSANDIIQNILFNKGLIIGMALYGIGFVSWIIALSKAEVSFAYMFNSIAFIIVSIGGYYFFGETMNMYKISGMVFVLVGIFLLTRS